MSIKCVFTLDDFCYEYRGMVKHLVELEDYFDNFKASMFTIPCYHGDFLSDHKDWLKDLPKSVEHVLHGWEHHNHEFKDIDYLECRKRVNLGIYEFMECGIPVVPAFKAPNWRYNENLCKVLSEKGFWLAIYTANSHRGSSGGRNIPVIEYNWDIATDIPEIELLMAHGHVHSCSGPGGYIGNYMDNIKKLPKDTKFLWLGEWIGMQETPVFPVGEKTEVISVSVDVIQTEEDKSKEQEWIKKREQLVEDRAVKWNDKVSVLITGHSEQRMFMEACVDSVKSLGWLLLTYDNPGGDYARRLPSDSVIQKLDQFFMKHLTKEMPGPTYPQFWNYRHGIDILMGSKGSHIFCIGADSILETPEGLPIILGMLGDNDIIACSSRNEKRHKAPYCNSKSFLAKKDAFKALVDYLDSTFVPFKSIGNMETRFGMGIQELGLKEVVVPVLPSEDQFAYDYDENGKSINRGTWGDILGYRHLGGEHKRRRLHKTLPIEEKYFDKAYLRTQELATIAEYWKTGDMQFVEKWYLT